MTAALAAPARFLSDLAALDALPLDDRAGWPTGIPLTPREGDAGKPHAVLYARISRDGEGKHLGVRRQVQSVWEMLDREGFVVVHIYRDNDISAFSGKHRPDYTAMMRRVENDSRVRAVGAWHTDRLHRNMRNLCDYIDVMKPRAVSTRCVSAGVMDLSTASGVMTAQIAAAVATQEVAHLRERILAKKEQQRTDGEWTGGRAPFGYVKSGKHTLATVETEADAIRAGATAVIAGGSVGAVAKMWNDAGHVTRAGRPWHATTVRSVLCSPTTVGRIAHGQQLTGVAAGWSAILDGDTWEGVRAVLNTGEPVRKLRPRSPKRLLSGVAVCGRTLPTGDQCGAPMKAGKKDDGTPIYRCSASEHVKRLAEPVDDLVESYVITRLSRPDAVELLTPDRSAEVAELHVRIAALRARKVQLAADREDPFSEVGEMDAEEYRAARAKNRALLADAEDRLSAVSAGSVLDELVCRPDLADIWGTLPIERRRAVVETVVTVTILPGKRGGNAASRNIAQDVADTVRIEER